MTRVELKGPPSNVAQDLLFWHVEHVDTVRTLPIFVWLGIWEQLHQS